MYWSFWCEYLVSVWVVWFGVEVVWCWCGYVDWCDLCWSVVGDYGVGVYVVGYDGLLEWVVVEMIVWFGVCGVVDVGGICGCVCWLSEFCWWCGEECVGLVVRLFVGVISDGVE